MTFPRYPEYKESGVEWLSEVPARWDTTRLRWLSRRYAGGTPSKDREDFWTDGTIPWINSGAVNAPVIKEPSALITARALESSSARWIPPEALVMALAGQGKTKGTVAQVGFRTTCNQSMAAIVPTEEVNARFLFWWLSSNYQNIRNMGGGDLRDGLNLELLGNIPCPVPDVDEQSQIVGFLDGETAKIDALVAEQKKLITLLKEKREALISHTVTKGLHPHAPMRDSGIEWLGQVPTHWGTCALTRVAQRIVVGIAEAATHAYSDGGVPILRSTNIRPGRIVGDILHILEEFALERESKLIHCGDLVTVRTGNAGVTAVVPQYLDGCQCFTMLITTLVEGSSADYYCYWINSRQAQSYFSIEGWGTAQVNISVPILKALPVPVPPLAEQFEIARELDRACSMIDLLAKEADRTIELLKERRSALISAAVTGKIDVRGFARADAA